MAEFDDLIPQADTSDPFQDLVPNKSSDLKSALTPDVYGGHPLTRAELAAKQVGADKSGTFDPFIPLGPDIQAETLPGQIAASAYNTGKGLLEGVESRGGIALLPAAEGGKLAQGALAAGFGIPGFVHGLKDVYEGAALGDRQRAIQGAVQALTFGGLTTAGAKSALAKEVAKVAEVEKPPEGRKNPLLVSTNSTP